MISSDNSIQKNNRLGVSCTSYNSKRSYIMYNFSDLDMVIKNAEMWFYREGKNNLGSLDLGFYYIEVDDWGTQINWESQPCQTQWSSNTVCDIKPFYIHEPKEGLGIWESFNFTDIVRNEEDKILSFVLKVIGSDTVCEIDQWIYYRNGSFLEIEGCIPNWELNEVDCQPNDIKFVYYTDENQCNSVYELPQNNGTYLSCDYCTPNWVAFNTSCNTNDTKIQYYIDENDCYSKTILKDDLEGRIENSSYFCDYCLSEWILNETWSDCQVGNTQYRNYYDINDCLGTEEPPESEIRSCNYTLSESMDIDKDEVYVFDKKDKTNISLEFMVFENISDGIINLTSYPNDPSESNFALADIGKYIEISVDQDILGNLSWCLIKFYYNDSDIIEYNVSEEDLKLYTFDEDLLKWVQIENSGVNTSFNYVWGNVSHFSFYSVFENKEYCGDGTCDSNETYSSCTEDCQPPTTTTSLFSGGGGGSVGQKTTTNTTSSTTTTVVTTTTIFSTTTTTVVTTTSTISNGSSILTGDITRPTGEFLLPSKFNIPIIISIIILIVGLVSYKFDSLRNKILNWKISFLKKSHQNKFNEN
jgi:hypothetical protein